jgi:hypothetical protein
MHTVGGTMKRLVGLLFTLCLLLPAFGGEATQTDWSGGDGVPGPVADWGDEFDASTDINWSEVPGEIGLSRAALDPTIEHSVDGDFDGASAVYAADIDGDDDIDVVGAGSNCDDITWWENDDGSGTSWTEHTVDDTFDGARWVYAADVDGDDDLDIIGAGFYADEIAWWENDDGSGTSWTKHSVDGDFDGALYVYAADVNGDDDLDILGAGYYPDDITWWENTDGAGTSWTEHTVDGAFDGAISVNAADVDGDGDMDVLGAAWLLDDISWWENDDGSGTSWTKHTVDDDFDGPRSVYAADVDGDDDLDILGAGFYADEITWWENDDGSGTSWIEHTVESNINGPESIYAADVDGDGDMDVLGAVRNAAVVIWWENHDGSGTSWTKHTVDDPFDWARSVYAADVDGDDDLDILGAAREDDDITWWEVTGFTDNGVLTSSILDTETDDLEWGAIDADAAVPGDSDLAVEVRGSADDGNMGDWYTVDPGGDDLSNYLDQDDRYFQYRLTLEASSDNTQSPTFEYINVEWTDTTDVEDVTLFATAENDGVLLAWTVTGDVPAAVRVLRGEENPVAVSGSLDGSTVRWLDRDVEPGGSYVYWLEVTDSDGYVKRFEPTEAVVVPEETQRLALEEPWPNPADNSVSVAFNLPEAQRVSLSVYDLAGRRVTTLSEGELPAGRHAVSWDCAGEASGVYLLRLETEGEALSRRVVVGR